MTSIPPQLIALFCVMFIALGIFNILTARRRQQRDGLVGVPWYKQVAILTAIEYILLALVFLLSLGITYKVLPSSLNGFLVPFLLLMILASGLLAGFVIFQGLTNMRRRRNPATRGTQANINGQVHAANNERSQRVENMTVQERAVYVQKRRERRQKAATARRRKAGKA